MYLHKDLDDRIRQLFMRQPDEITALVKTVYTSCINCAESCVVLGGTGIEQERIRPIIEEQIGLLTQSTGLVVKVLP